jgi:hypothetical protein
MGKRRVQLWEPGKGRYILIDDRANEGAVVGVDLKNPDGTEFVPDDRTEFPPEPHKHDHKTDLWNVGDNTHDEIDDHIDNEADPHNSISWEAAPVTGSTLAWGSRMLTGQGGTDYTYTLDTLPTAFPAQDILLWHRAWIYEDNQITIFPTPGLSFRVAGENFAVDVPITMQAGSIARFVRQTNSVILVSITQNLWQNQSIVAFNQTGGTLTKGTVVRIIDSNANVSVVAPAQADAPETSRIVGLVAQDFGNGTRGIVQISGVMVGVDTSLFVEGDFVFLSPTAAGGMTATRPEPPNYASIIGQVLKQDAVNGWVLIIPDNIVVDDAGDLVFTPPEPANVVVSDTYQDLNGTDPTTRAPVIGTAPVATGGTWEVNALECERVETTGDARLVYDSGAADVEIEVQLTPGVIGTEVAYGIVFRNSGATYYTATFYDGIVYLQYFDGGSFIPITSNFAPLQVGVSGVLKVRVVSGTAEVFWDGNTVLTGSVSGFNLTSTEHGIRQNFVSAASPNTLFDNFSVVDLAPSGALQNIPSTIDNVQDAIEYLSLIKLEALGGSTLQVLAKASNADNDVEWITAPVSPSGGVALQYRWQSDITATDPGAGNIKVNNADQTLATELYVNDLTRNGNDAGFIWEDVVKGEYVGVWEEFGDNETIYYLITATQDNVGWHTLTVDHIPGTLGGLDNNQQCTVLLIPNPLNKLPLAGETEQVLAKATATDYDASWQYRQNWKGNWQPQEYLEGNVVFDNPWLMVANKTTTDRAAPQPLGAAEWAMPDVPAWANFQDTAVIASGHIYDFTNAGVIQGVRVWVPTTGPNITYRLAVLADGVYRNQDITAAIGDRAGEWVFLGTTSESVLAGAQISVWLETTNSGADTIITGGWNRGINSNTNPLTSEWNRNSSNTILRIDKTDLDTVGRTAELLGVVAGSTINIVETANVNASRTWITSTNAVDGGSAVTYNIVDVDIGPAGEPAVGVACTITITVPIPSAADFVGIVNGWVGTEPVWADVTSSLLLDGVDQGADPDNQYGVDINFQRYTASPDWDIQSAIGSGGVSGGGDSSPFPEAPTDGDSYLRRGSDASWQKGYDRTESDARYALTASGVPAGGVKWQSLYKVSSTDLDTGWLAFPHQLLGIGAGNSLSWGVGYKISGAQNNIAPDAAETDNPGCLYLNYSSGDCTLTPVLGQRFRTAGVNQPVDGTITIKPGQGVWLFPHTATVVGVWFNDVDKYTVAEVDALLAGKTDTGHTHLESDITDLGNYTLVGHTHLESDITDFGTYPDASASLVGFTPVVDGSSGWTECTYPGRWNINPADLSTLVWGERYNVSSARSLATPAVPDIDEARRGILVVSQCLTGQDVTLTIDGARRFRLNGTNQPLGGSVVLSPGEVAEYRYQTAAVVAINVWGGSSSTGIGEAPINGTPYVRQDGGWIPEGTSSGFVPEAPNDGQLYGRELEAWAVIDASLWSHSDIQNLGADDHTQYYNQARGDARYAQLVHTHTESQITDLDKYTQAQVDSGLAGKADTVHTHTESNITDLDKYTQAEVDALLAGSTITEDSGTWTPSISAGIGSPSYSTRNGTWYRVGNMVTASFDIQLTSKGTLGPGPTDQLKLSGLPFSSPSGNGFVYAANFAYIRGMAHLSNVWGQLLANSSEIAFQTDQGFEHWHSNLSSVYADGKSQNFGSTTHLDQVVFLVVGSITNSFQCRGSITYVTNDPFP